MHQIGIGVLGPIYRTYDPSEDRLVAVKAFHLDITPEQSKALIDELAQIISSGLSNPAIVLPITVGIEQDIPYLAQEYVAAESLDVALRHYVPATLNTALPFIVQMSEAIDTAHRYSILHGGLHLRDIFVTPDRARLTGFGVTKALETIGLKGPIRRPYTSPEVISGREWGPEADRFSLAAVAYELLTGKRAAGLGEQITERLGLVEGVADIESLQMVFSRALAQNPEMRFSSGADFVAALTVAVGEIDDENQAETVSSAEKVDRNLTKVSVDLFEGLGFHQDASLPVDNKVTQDEIESLDTLVADSTELNVGARAEIPNNSDQGDLNMASSKFTKSINQELPVQYPFPEETGSLESDFIANSKSSYSKRWKFNRLIASLGVIVGILGVGAYYIGSSFLTGSGIVNDKTLDIQETIVNSDHSENTKLAFDESSQEVSSSQVGSVVTVPEVELPREQVSALQSGNILVDQPRLSNVESGLVSNQENDAGWILVRTMPADAEVIIDGVSRGRTPMSVSGVPFGKHSVEVKRTGYNIKVQEVVLSSASSVGAVDLELDLVGIDSKTSVNVGSIFVDSRPAGALVVVDDRVFGETPLVISELVLGTRHIRIERNGYKVWETTVEIKPLEQIRVAASLDRKPIQ